MMKPLVFATRNRGKLVELRELLPGIEVRSLDDVHVPEVIEDGLTGCIVEDEIGAAAAVERARALDRGRIRAEFERRFCARRMAEDYVALYETMVRHRGAPHLTIAAG